MNNEHAAAVAEVKEVSAPTHGATFKEIALPLVARGIPVIPIPPRQKGAILKNWQNLATTDLKQIEAWHQENPEYNVGSVAKLTGFWMLDCDVPDLKQIIEKDTTKVFPQTFSVSSQKGLHFYFKHTAVSQSLNKNISLKDEQGKPLGDVKLHNGYVVGPGSLHPEGKLYEVTSDCEIVEAPDWLVTWIKERREHAEADQMPTKKPIKQGERNNALFKEACKQRKSGVTLEAAVADLLAVNEKMCAPTLPVAEVQKIVESAYSYELVQKYEGPSLTDFGNAERFVQAENNNVRYCCDKKSWYVWNDCAWREDKNGAIYRLGKKTIKGMFDEAAQLDDNQRNILTAYERKCESEGRLHAMVNLARWEPGVPIELESFDTNPMLFNCSNVTIDLATGQPQEHCRQDLISKSSPIQYDANAGCPIWLKFLDTVTNSNSELRDYLQRCAGYSLTGQTTEHAVFLLYGNGANGKSTFFEALRYILGDYAQAAEFSTFLASNAQGVRNDLAKLNAARFVTAVESDYGKRLDETLVKQMTAGDTVTARFLYSEHFEYKPQFKLWLGTNHKPTIRGQDEGVWRRIRLIPFTVSIPLEQQDRNLIEKLKPEAPGILNWALKGLAEWWANGLQDPALVKKATKDYRMDEDVMGSFIEEKCVRKGQVTASDMYKAYRDWAEHGGEFELNQRRFSNALIERGFEKARRNTGFVWKGIRLIEGDDVPTGNY